MTTTTDADLFLRSVCADPAADAPRLVFADWLEENGEPERSEFIRLQCELARMDEAGEGQLPEDGHTCYQDPCPVCASVDKYNAFRAREGKLALAHLRGWFSFPDDGHVAAITDVRFVGLECTYFVRRGFVAAVALTLEQFMGGVCRTCAGGLNLACRPYNPAMGPPPLPDRRPKCDGSGTTPGIVAALFAAAPLEDVRLTDREPAHSLTGRWWASVRSVGCHPQSILPDELFRLLPGIHATSVLSGSYRSPAAAHAALSRACIAYGRGLVGLPA